MYVCFFSGESGIRTRGTLLAHTRFPGVPLQPLEHLSNSFFQKRAQITKKNPLKRYDLGKMNGDNVKHFYKTK